MVFSPETVIISKVKGTLNITFYFVPPSQCLGPKIINIYSFKLDSDWLQTSLKPLFRCFTSSVPVHVCDVTGHSFTDANSLGAQHIVDVNKAVM